MSEETKKEKNDMKRETEQKINQLQLIEQNLQSFLLQKQQFQNQLIELESALNELESTENAYKIVGNIMVAVKKEDLKTELLSKKETVELRIRTLEKQEQKIKEKADSIQKEVLKEMGQNE